MACGARKDQSVASGRFGEIVQAQFTQLFTLLRPAAMDLQTIYVQQQGLTMELLYQPTVNLAPALESGPAEPADFRHY